MGAKKEYYPGLGERIARRLIELGYVQKSGRPDVLRFAAEHRYIASYLYTWIGQTTPEYQNLLRLAADLRVELGWLGFGEAARDIPRHSNMEPLKSPPRSRKRRGRV
jgi:hypothetical protein